MAKKAAKRTWDIFTAEGIRACIRNIELDRSAHFAGTDTWKFSTGNKALSRFYLRVLWPEGAKRPTRVTIQYFNTKCIDTPLFFVWKPNETFNSAALQGNAYALKTEIDALPGTPEEIKRASADIADRQKRLMENAGVTGWAMGYNKRPGNGNGHAQVEVPAGITAEAFDEIAAKLRVALFGNVAKGRIARRTRTP